MFTRNDEYEILTPTGWCDFAGVLQSGTKPAVTITTESGHITCSPQHPIYEGGTPIEAQHVRVGDMVDTTTGPAPVLEVVTGDSEVEMYDIVEVNNGNHQFIVNSSIITKNCDETAFVRPSIQQEFWASISPTLATGGKMFMTSTPNGDSDLFATLWRGATSGTNGFFPMTIKWNEVPGRDKNFKATEIAKNGILKWEQEYECAQGVETVKVMDEFGNIIEMSLENLYLTLAQQPGGDTHD